MQVSKAKIDVSVQQDIWRCCTARGREGAFQPLMCSVIESYHFGRKPVTQRARRLPGRQPRGLFVKFPGSSGLESVLRRRGDVQGEPFKPALSTRCR